MKLLTKYKAYIPPAVYGGVDGTISTFAVVAGAYGGDLKTSSIFILGLASLVADGFSMAVSAYLAAQSGSDKHPSKKALATFSSFIVLGSMLLIPYFASLFLDIDRSTIFIMSSVLAIIAFMLVATLKAKAEKTSLSSQMIQVVLLGLIAAGIAYGIGDGLERIIS